MKRILAIISGNVIGVFFRRNTKIKADSLNLKGYIKNLPNGNVEALFEGEDSSIKKIIEYLKNPGFTKVISLKIKEEKYQGNYDNFEIEYI